MWKISRITTAEDVTHKSASGVPAIPDSEGNIVMIIQFFIGIEIYIKKTEGSQSSLHYVVIRRRKRRNFPFKIVRQMALQVRAYFPQNISIAACQFWWQCGSLNSFSTRAGVPEGVCARVSSMLSSALKYCGSFAQILVLNIKNDIIVIK